MFRVKVWNVTFLLVSISKMLLVLKAVLKVAGIRSNLERKNIVTTYLEVCLAKGRGVDPKHVSYSIYLSFLITIMFRYFPASHVVSRVFYGVFLPPFFSPLEGKVMRGF